MSKKKLLAVGYFVKGTGFTRVLDSIFSRLSEEYEIHLIGINYKGPIIHDKYIIYPNNVEGGDVYGAYQCAEKAALIRPDVIFLLNDFWMLKNYKNALSDYSIQGGKIVAYAPLDGYIVDESILLELDYVSELVVYNQFAKNEVEKAVRRIQKSNLEYQFVPISVIAHGVDTNKFSVLPNKTELKRKWFPQIITPEDAIIVLNANRYDKRKRIDLCIEAFAMSLKGKAKNVYLYLHNASATEEQKDEIKRLAKDYNCESHILTAHFKGDGYLTDADLNELYNACEIGINTSMGEGWGLISFEHAATGAAQVLPEDPAGKELWQESADFISTKKKRPVPFSPFEMITIDVQQTAELLERLYLDEKYRNEMADRGLTNSQQRKYSWDNVSLEWSKLFMKITSLNHQTVNH